MWGGCICHSKVGVIRNSHPLTPSEGLLFQTVAMDFITKLPKLGKYNTILTSQIMTVLRQLSLSHAKKPSWQREWQHWTYNGYIQDMEY